MTGPGAPPPSRLRRAAALAALAAVAAAICLLLAEGVLHLAPGFEPPERWFPGEQPSRVHPTFVADPELGWRMRPSHRHERKTGEFDVVYASNAQGFRAEADFDPADARRRIAVVGDSFTFGLGVGYAQTWPALLEAGLPDVAVYDLAMPGFGIDQMWVAVRTQALPLHPDLVIIGFIGDDFARSLTAHRADVHMSKPLFVLGDDGRPRAATPEDRPSAAWRFVEAHSRVWAALQRVSRLVARWLPHGEWWTLNAALLDAIDRDCREAGVPVLFVHLPTLGGRAFPALADHLRREGAAYLDLGEPGRAPPGLHFASDRHPNARGHAWIAEQTLAWIRRERPALASPPGNAAPESRGPRS